MQWMPGADTRAEGLQSKERRALPPMGCRHASVMIRCIPAATVHIPAATVHIPAATVHIPAATLMCRHSLHGSGLVLMGGANWFMVPLRIWLVRPHLRERSSNRL